MTRLLYTLVIHALLPWAVLHLLWRARRQRDYLQHWGERFGRYHAVLPAPTLWIHAVSVGETRAAQPLVAALRQRYPGHRILLTQMTPTGRATAEALFGDTVTCAYLPYDTPGAVNAFLRHFRPQIGVVLETELWPNLVAACKVKGMPLLLVNARLSEKSARRYARYPRLTGAALQGLSAIAAQGEADAQRLRALGAPRVEVFGSLKFDIDPPGDLADFRALVGSRPVFLCASTREGEEALILDEWLKLGAGNAAQNAALLVIAPRHPQRFDAVARLIEDRKLVLQRRSDQQPVAAATHVWLGDSMGELFAYYAAADVAFVGGSLLDYGSQNLIEPCAVGTPVLIGPSTFNFTDAAQNALAAGAALQVETSDELLRTAVELMDDAAERQRMGEAGRAFAEQHRGATAKTLALIAPYIPESS